MGTSLPKAAGGEVSDYASPEDFSGNDDAQVHLYFLTSANNSPYAELTGVFDLAGTASTCLLVVQKKKGLALVACPTTGLKVINDYAISVPVNVSVEVCPVNDLTRPVASAADPELPHQDAVSLVEVNASAMNDSFMELSVELPTYVFQCPEGKCESEYVSLLPSSLSSAVRSLEQFSVYFSSAAAVVGDDTPPSPKSPTTPKGPVQTDIERYAAFGKGSTVIKEKASSRGPTTASLAKDVATLQGQLTTLMDGTKGILGHLNFRPPPAPPPMTSGPSSSSRQPSAAAAPPPQRPRVNQSTAGPKVPPPIPGLEPSVVTEALKLRVSAEDVQRMASLIGGQRVTVLNVGVLGCST